MTGCLAFLPAALGKYIPKRESSDPKYYNLYSSTKFWWHPPYKGVMLIHVIETFPKLSKSLQAAENIFTMGQVYSFVIATLYPT